MCEPVDLDEWIKEVKGDATPASFNDRLPETKPPGEYLSQSMTFFAPMLHTPCCCICPIAHLNAEAYCKSEGWAPLHAAHVKVVAQKNSGVFRAYSSRTPCSPYSNMRLIGQILLVSNGCCRRFTAGPETKASGHSGILESAKAVLEDLQSTGVLQQLMQEPPVSPCLRPARLSPCTQTIQQSLACV